jgi:hypothetical protein
MFVHRSPAGILFLSDLKRLHVPMKNTLVAGVSRIALHGVGRVDRWCCRNCRYVQVVSETDQARAQRVHSVSRKRNFALSLRGFRPMVALSITAIQPGMWSSASTTWRQQLRKRPDAVATALNILLGERKLQKAPLSGYWKLNV